MATEEQAPHLPRFSVTHQAFREGDHAFSRQHFEHLDRMFPLPQIREPGVEYLGTLGCPEDLIPLVKSLDTPWKVQAYINQHVTYDHSEATRGFVSVVRDNLAHCFEGAEFAYTALWAHGWNPRIVLLQADNKYGEDHNIVVYRYGNRLGSVAMSAWETLKGRPPVFPSLRDLVGFGYWFPYTSELEPKYQGVHNLVGYSDPIDLVAKFDSTDWLFREGADATWFIFQRYTDGLTCTHLFTGERYPYPQEKLLGDDLEDGKER